MDTEAAYGDAGELHFKDANRVDKNALRSLRQMADK